ncbi:MAG: NADPH-dependent assimilatory sulfite reductase hemoprotein subunit [Deinococcales bacterium]
MAKANKVESYKLESNYLRGPVAEELASETLNVSEESYQLLKFSGLYQQDDRDQRKALREQGLDRAWSFMLRGKSSGGALSAKQYLVYDELADLYGNGTLRFTTRQAIQLHGIIKHDLKATLQKIHEALLTSLGGCGDVSRNVMACPAPEASRKQALLQDIAKDIDLHLMPRSGAYYELWIDGEKQKVADVPSTVYTQAVDEVEPIYGKTYLPRKFKIGIAFPEDNCVDVFTQDIGIVPVMLDDELKGYNLLVGGGMGMSHTDKDTFPRLGDRLGMVEPQQLLAAVEGIVSIQRDYGNRENRKLSRMKYLLEDWGVERFKQELEVRVGFKLSPWFEVGEFKLDDHLGWREQGDGRYYFGLPIENGRIKDDENQGLRSAIREILRALGCEIRISPQHNMLFINLKAEDKDFIEAILRNYRVKTRDEISLARRYGMACPALPTCSLAVADAERALPGVIEGLEPHLISLGLTQDPISIRMTGCPNGCARPYTAELAFVGQSLDLYKIYVGGSFEGTRLVSEYAEKVPRHALVDRVVPLLRYWKDHRNPQEKFGDFCHRIGIDTLITLNLNESALALSL